MELPFWNPHHVVPPSGKSQILLQPFSSRETIELAIFHDHRYSFFDWNKWTRKRNKGNPPSVVSIDWHQDLCRPSDTEKEWLVKLDLRNDSEVALYSWASLASNNDGHILCAAYLNLIQNIYVLCRQGSNENQWKDRVLIDKYGNIHAIKVFRTIHKLESALIGSQESKIYFDIDLDYFVIDSPFLNNANAIVSMRVMEIEKLLNPASEIMQWILRRLQGFTIATEPEHCSGILRSNSFLSIVCNLFFKGDPIAWNSNFGWKWHNL